MPESESTCIFVASSGVHEPALVEVSESPTICYSRVCIHTVVGDVENIIGHYVGVGNVEAVLR